jgi:hypothetical protein
MAKLQTRFDATAVDTEQRGEYEELPNGLYQLEVTEADVAPTKSGNGTILKTTNRVLAPIEYEGRLLFNSYNLENANEIAQRIGQKQFGSLCRALELDGVEDTDELLYKGYYAKVKLGKPSKDGTYPARAEIGTFLFPDQFGPNTPVPAIDDNQPARPAAANDNRAAANDNGSGRTAPAAQTGGAKKARPWG